MRSISRWFAAAVILTGAVVAGGKEKPFIAGQPAPSPLLAEKSDPEVAKLIKDIGDDDYRTREKAGRLLAALGEKALPQMRARCARPTAPRSNGAWRSWSGRWTPSASLHQSESPSRRSR